MRTQSNRAKTLKDGSQGWLHSLDVPMPLRIPVRQDKPQRKVNCQALLSKWWEGTKQTYLQTLAELLGVEEWAIKSVGYVWAQEHGCWALPFWDGLGHVIGIQLRWSTGFKRTMTDTHNGLILPAMDHQPTVMICEGASDTCVALGLGYYAVGRPSCSGGAPMIKDLIRRTAVKRAVILADNDDPGLNGAKMLTTVLQVPCCIITLPAKDLREFVRQGGDRQTIDALANASVWHYRK